MFRRLLTGVIGIVFAAALLLPQVQPAAQAQHQLSIIASTSILADVASNVAGDAASVESLFPRGANAHTAEPSAQDVARLSDADVVLIVGANYEEGLLPVLEEAGGQNVVTASLCVPIQPVRVDFGAQTSETVATAEPQADGSAVAAQCAGHYDAVKAAFGVDEVGEPGALGPLYALACGGHEAESGGEDVHPVGSCDPHVWTDPINAALWALQIRDVLSEHDPDNAAIYAANTETYLAALAQTDAQIKNIIDPLPQERRLMLTNHLTFGYFAQRYGLSIVGVIIPGGSTTAEPSTQDVLALIQTIQDYRLPAIFTENVVSGSLASQIADETGSKIVRLYTESLSESGDGADTYINYLLFNANAIAEALK
jgi:ABC-type Zn uptake system ZnuABC Zn-binding protein ZnuA